MRPSELKQKIRVTISSEFFFQKKSSLLSANSSDQEKCMIRKSDYESRFRLSQEPKNDYYVIKRKVLIPSFNEISKCLELKNEDFIQITDGPMCCLTSSKLATMPNTPLLYPKKNRNPVNKIQLLIRNINKKQKRICLEPVFELEAVITLIKYRYDSAFPSCLKQLMSKQASKIFKN